MICTVSAVSVVTWTVKRAHSEQTRGNEKRKVQEHYSGTRVSSALTHSNINNRLGGYNTEIPKVLSITRNSYYLTTKLQLIVIFWVTLPPDNKENPVLNNVRNIQWIKIYYVSFLKRNYCKTSHCLEAYNVMDLSGDVTARKHQDLKI